MKKWIIIFGLCMLILLTGCMNKYHGFDFNATSNSDCAVKCEKLMNDYYCWEATPSYSESYTNGDKNYGVCSCYVRTCRE